MEDSLRMPSWYRQLLRHDFPTFIGKTLSTVDPSAEYLPNWHIDLIAEYLEAVRRGEITRLIINMPPRALKSVCVSVAWPAWLLGHDPSSRIMAASYSAELAVKHSLDCRLVLRSGWYRRVFPEVMLIKGQNRKHKFATTGGGGRYATSVGGSVTGEGGNFLILDDPINPLQAMSAHSRTHVNDWFDHTFASRLNDKRAGAIVLVMHRLHEQDLSGHLLAKGGFTHLSLPAIAPARTTLRFGRVKKIRKSGEALHPLRENTELIERARLELGSYAFAAQYQQDPVGDKGHMLLREWFVRYDKPPTAPTRIVQSWDTAIKSGPSHDASVCLTFAEQDGISYLLDVRSLRAEYPDLKRAMTQQAKRWSPHVILIEDKGSGQQLLQDMRRETTLPLIARHPKQDKVTRVGGVSALIEAGRVALPPRARWLAEFEKEVLAFPNGAHDDQVDALTQYLDWLRSTPGQIGLRTF